MIYNLYENNNIFWKLISLLKCKNTITQHCRYQGKGGTEVTKYGYLPDEAIKILREIYFGNVDPNTFYNTTAISTLKAWGYIDEQGKVTKQGVEVLRAYGEI